MSVAGDFNVTLASVYPVMQYATELRTVLVTIGKTNRGHAVCNVMLCEIN